MMARKRARQRPPPKAADKPYALAKESFASEGYSGPDWAPAGLWKASQQPTTASEGEVARLLIEGPKTEELWSAIAETFPEQCNLIADELARRCAEFKLMWQTEPKRTPKEHGAWCEEMARCSEKVGEGVFQLFRVGLKEPRDLNFAALWPADIEKLKQREEQLQRFNHSLVNQTLQRVGKATITYEEYTKDPLWSCYDDCEQMKKLLWGQDTSVVPNLPEQLKSIALWFKETAMHPRLRKPGEANAECNFLVSLLIQFFHWNCQHVSPKIVSEIMAIVFGHAIEENAVSKRYNRLPWGIHETLEDESSYVTIRWDFQRIPD